MKDSSNNPDWKMFGMKHPSKNLTQTNEEGSRIRWRAAIGGVVALEVSMIAAAFAWVAFYSHVVHPGGTIAYYEAYAKVASPIVSLVAGVPAFWLAGKLLMVWFRADARATAVALVCIYLLLDATVIATLAEDQKYNWLLAIPNGFTKVGAILWATRRRLGQSSKEPQAG